MAGEWTYHDWTATNVEGDTLTTPGVVLVLDVPNCLQQKVAVALPDATSDPPIGVLVDKVRLSPLDQTVEPNQPVRIRTHGAFWIPCTAAVVTAGDFVAIGDTTGRVVTATTGLIVGRALTTTSGTLGDTALVLLMIGSKL